MKTSVKLEKVIREFDEMIYVRACWFNEAVLNRDKREALVNLMIILELVTLRGNITGENYNELADYYYNPIKEKYEIEFLNRGE